MPIYVVDFYIRVRHYFYADNSTSAFHVTSEVCDGIGADSFSDPVPQEYNKTAKEIIAMSPIYRNWKTCLMVAKHNAKEYNWPGFYLAKIQGQRSAFFFKSLTNNKSVHDTYAIIYVRKSLFGFKWYGLKNNSRIVRRLTGQNNNNARGAK